MHNNNKNNTQISQVDFYTTQQASFFFHFYFPWHIFIGRVERDHTTYDYIVRQDQDQEKYNNKNNNSLLPR